MKTETTKLYIKQSILFFCKFATLISQDRSRLTTSAVQSITATSLFAWFCFCFDFFNDHKKTHLIHESIKYKMNFYRFFSLPWPASMQIYRNKRRRLHTKIARVQLLQDWLGTPTWPPLPCFGTPIMPSWRHVKTDAVLVLYSGLVIFVRGTTVCPFFGSLHWRILIYLVKFEKHSGRLIYTSSCAFVLSTVNVPSWSSGSSFSGQFRDFFSMAIPKIKTMMAKSHNFRRNFIAYLDLIVFSAISKPFNIP